MLALPAPIAWGQAGAAYGLQLTAHPLDEAGGLLLVWPPSGGEAPHDYRIHRRTPGVGPWGEPIGDTSAVAVLEDGRRAFHDPGAEPGVAYEYSVSKRFVVDASTGETHRAFGYIQAGSGVPLVEHRGAVILVVGEYLLEPLAAEIDRLHHDLVGDGWRVIRQAAGAAESPADVKARIRDAYSAAPDQVKAVFLLGRVPVPYSGNFQPSPPDGHTAPGDDHRGAWPADGYYADMDGEWTDATAHYINHNSARATNVPGDGKFDPSYLPSDLELQIGRVDLSSLPGTYAAEPFPDEVSLVRFYLEKNHAWRHGRLPVRRQALIGDSRDASRGRAYSASAYRSFAPMFGPERLVIASTEAGTPEPERWLNRLKADSYLWSYGFGAGSYTSVSGLGNRPPYHGLYAGDLVDEGANGVFHLLFGSWFGDWDQPDNLLRTTLLTRFGLAAAWSGRPHLVFHPMALGETLGHCIRINQNNETTYENEVNTFRRGIHLALLGDPTLRLHPVPPPADVRAARVEGGTRVTWQRGPGERLRHHVYRAESLGGEFVRLTPEPVVGLEFVDTQEPGSGTLYLVRAITLEVTPSGSYFNASQGGLAAIGAGPD